MWDSYRQEKIVSIEAVQPCAARFITRDYLRTSSAKETFRSLDLDQLEHGPKFHQLSIFYLALNNSIALAIPNYFSPKQRSTRSSLITLLSHPVAIMIIIFIVFSKNNKRLVLSTK